MKKIISVALMVFVISLFSCKKSVETKVNSNLNPRAVSITFGEKTSNYVSIN